MLHVWKMSLLGITLGVLVGVVAADKATSYHWEGQRHHLHYQSIVLAASTRARAVERRIATQYRAQLQHSDVQLVDSLHIPGRSVSEAESQLLAGSSVSGRSPLFLSN